MMLAIKEITESDLNGLLELYTQLHDNPIPQIDEKINKILADILNDKNHHVLIGCIENRIVSSCVLVTIPNLTHFQRPYAIIENVITDEKYRNKGYATEILNFARQIAINEDCYKIMLMTGSKKESTLKFYEKCGYNKDDKTAFIQWL